MLLIIEKERTEIPQGPTKSRSALRNKALMRGSNKENDPKSIEAMDLTSSDYERIFKRWLITYISENLTLKMNEFDKSVFIIDSTEITERINPDIQGNMAKSLMFSGKMIANFFISHAR